MFITGPQAQDLVMKPAFTGHAMQVLEELARECADGPAMGIGGPYAFGYKLYNAYCILKGGEVTARVLKHRLPNETVFDEARVFDAGSIHGPYRIGSLRIGSPICEDAWRPDVPEALAESGAEICWCRTDRRTIATSTTCGWGTWWRVRSRPGCRWSTSTWWACRTIRSSTAGHSC